MLLVHRLAKGISQQSLLLVTTRRPLPSRTGTRAVGTQFESLGVPLHPVEPLDEDAAVDLATRLLGAPPEQTGSCDSSPARRQPFYLTELIGALLREGRILVEDGQLRHAAEHDELPASLSAVIARRLEFFPQPAREILSAAAILGVEFDPGELARILELPFATVLDSLRQATTPSWWWRLETGWRSSTT